MSFLDIRPKQLAFVEGNILSPENCSEQLQDNSYVCFVSEPADFSFCDSDATVVLQNTNGSFTLLSINSIFAHHAQANERDALNDYLLFQILQVIGEGLTDLVKSLAGY